MKRFLYFISFIGATFFLISNTAQPGVWSAGGSGSFTLLYPEDSSAYKKIQMQSEKIYMQLYKGYAVVKGTYHFYNTSDDTLKIKVGYPINNVFKNVDYNRELNEVQVDGLYKIKAQLNEVDIPVFKIPNNENDNWYVWEVTYPPKKMTTFTVYFLVNTNNAVILEGYNKEYKNAFIYLIETGSLWKSPIEKGAFYTQLMDAIDTETIKGSVPTQLEFYPQEKTFRFTMEDYGKTPDPNFVLTYGATLKEFDFKKITQNSRSLFTAIDEFSTQQFNDYAFTNITLKSPYKVNGVGGFFVGFLYFFFIFGVPILGILTFLFIVYYLYKRFKK